MLTYGPLAHLVERCHGMAEVAGSNPARSTMHGYVYILCSTITNKFYVGSTIDLSVRISQHNTGLVTSTKSGRPWELKFYKEYINIADARRMEYKLKKMKSRCIIQKIIDEQEIKMQVG